MYQNEKWFTRFIWLVAIWLFIQSVVNIYNALTDPAHIILLSIGAVSGFVVSTVLFRLSYIGSWNKRVAAYFFGAFGVDLLGVGLAYAVSSVQGEDPKNSIASLIIVAIAFCFATGLWLKAASLREKY